MTADVTAPVGGSYFNSLPAGALHPPMRPLGTLEYTGSEQRLKGQPYTAEEARALAASLRSLGYAAELRGETLVVTAEAAP